jgi:hypothetical protein
LARRALAAPALAEMAREHDLYKSARGHSMNDMAGRMRSDIRIFQVGQEAFRVEFAYAGPVTAQRVTNNLVSRFVEENFQLALANSERYQVGVTGTASLPGAPEGPSRLGWIGSGLAGGALLGVAAAWLIRRRAIVNA